MHRGCKPFFHHSKTEHAIFRGLHKSDGVFALRFHMTLLMKAAGLIIRQEF
jgi:hypothetical protein